MSKKERTLDLSTDIAESEVSSCIYTLRGCQVMMDSDLAKLYNVETRILKRAVRSNIERFPDQFMFEPTKYELETLRSKFWISKLPDNLEARGGSRYSPFVFTELGVAMLSTVIHSDRAIQISIGIMKVFVQFRSQLNTNQADLAPKFESLESGFAELKNRFDLFENRLLGDAVPNPGLPVEDRVRVIQNAVARHWGLTVEDLKSGARKRAISLARQVAVFLIRKHLCMAFSEIGQHFGQRDHTTILHAYRKIHADSEDNGIVRGALVSLQRELQPMLS